MVTFEKKIGFDFDISYLKSMFIRDVIISDDIYHMRLDKERRQSEITRR